MAKRSVKAPRMPKTTITSGMAKMAITTCQRWKAKHGKDNNHNMAKTLMKAIKKLAMVINK